MRSTRPPPGSALADTFVEHLSALYAVATFLVHEPPKAEQAVIRALELIREDPTQVSVACDDRRATLVAAVHRSCREILEADDSPVPGPPDSSPIGSLTEPERSALALVALGGHSYRTAAATLGIEPSELAGQLTSGLHRFHDRHSAEPLTAIATGHGQDTPTEG